MSPCRRTIQTACALLKDHPNKANLTLILTPGALEHVGFKNILMLHADALRAYCLKMEEEFGLNFNTAFLLRYGNPRWWFLDYVPNLEVRSALKAIVEEKHLDSAHEDEYDVAVYLAMKEYYITEMLGKKGFETIPDFITRGKAFKD